MMARKSVSIRVIASAVFCVLVAPSFIPSRELLSVGRAATSRLGERVCSIWPRNWKLDGRIYRVVHVMYVKRKKYYAVIGISLADIAV